ncbi:MAG: hypothetical protein Q4G35_08285 [Propionibacteriaceae bacterium]|nr:hypothetical protein [Propionibacteriaceae bacterium]
MNRSAEWFEAGAAGSCPGLWAIRGTLGTVRRGLSKHDELIEPLHVLDDTGRCKHCGQETRR